MTPKEKAIDLVEKYFNSVNRDNLRITTNWASAIECVLVAVDEIQKYSTQAEEISKLTYWENVRQEIEKL